MKNKYRIVERFKTGTGAGTFKAQRNILFIFWKDLKSPAAIEYNNNFTWHENREGAIKLVNKDVIKRLNSKYSNLI